MASSVRTTNIMSCNTLCPFRTLSKDVQLAICFQMSETELKALSEICAVAKEFMKANFWTTLKLHPEDRISITADKRAVSVFVTGPHYKIDGRKINLESYSTIAPVSVDHLNITITDFSKIAKVKEVINKMKPTCNSASFYGGIHSSIVLDWANAMKCPNGVFVECSENERGIDILENLTQIENTASSHLSFSGLSDYDDLLDDVRLFGKVDVETTSDRIQHFIYNLLNGKELGDLKEITFSTQNDSFGNCSSRRLTPAATLLYKKNKEMSFSKLTLENNMCLFIEEKVIGKQMVATCKLMEDNDEEILDLLLTKSNAPQSNIEEFFGPKGRNSYFSLNDVSREEYMRKINPLNIIKIPCGFGVLIK